MVGKENLLEFYADEQASVNKLAESYKCNYEYQMQKILLGMLLATSLILRAKPADSATNPGCHLH